MSDHSNSVAMAIAWALGGSMIAILAGRPVLIITAVGGPAAGLLIILAVKRIRASVTNEGPAIPVNK